MSMPSYSERFHMSLRDSLVRLRGLLLEMEPEAGGCQGRPSKNGDAAWADGTDLGDVLKQLQRTGDVPSSKAVANLIHRLDAYLKLPGEK